MVVFIHNVFIKILYIFSYCLKFKVVQWENTKIHSWLDERALHEKGIPKRVKYSFNALSTS